MARGVLKDGQIHPLEPLPGHWRDGQELRIESVDEPTAEEIDRDFAELAALCADSDPDEEEQLAQALQEAREQSKTLVRKQMGLTE